MQVPGGHSLVLPRRGMASPCYCRSTPGSNLGFYSFGLPLLGFLFDTLLIPVIGLEAEGVRHHHTTGSVWGLSLSPAPVRSVEGALLSRGTGDPRSMERNLLEICGVCAKASCTVTETE